MTTRTVNQHFVPRFYLRNFSVNGDGNNIWVLNKATNSVFRSSIADAGSENNFFYDPTVEPRITEFENIVLPAYNTVLQRFTNDDLAPLSGEIVGLSLLVTLQWWRTKKFRKELDHNIKYAKQTIADNLRTVNKMNPDDTENLLSGYFTEEPIEDFQAEMLFNYDSIQKVANTFIDDFYLTIAISRLDTVLITSDNPVSMKVRHLGEQGNEIVFSLADKLLLILNHTTTKNKSRLVELSEEATFISNSNQHRSCNQFLYSSDKETLMALL